MAKAMTPGDLEALDRLQRELRLVNESAAAEMAALRQERDQVRSRVAGILEHLEGLDI